MHFKLLPLFRPAAVHSGGYPANGASFRPTSHTSESGHTMEDGAAPGGAATTSVGLPDDLCALDAAPTHGLNARALILRAAAEAEAGEGELHLPAAGPDPVRLAVAGRAAAVRAGRALAAAWPQAEKPYPDLIRRSKVPRAARVPVLARLAGEHLALALHGRGGRPAAALASDPAAAVRGVATPADRAAAVAAARTQELGLYRDAANGGAYTARSARATALDAGEAEAVAAAEAGAAAPAPRRVLKRSAPPVESDRRAGPDPNPAPRKRATEAEAAAEVVSTAVAAGAPGDDWTAGEAGLDPHTAVRACGAGQDLAALLQAALAPLKESGELSPAAAAAALESAVSKVLAAHGAAALAGERVWLDGPGARERLTAFAVACGRTAAAREARAAKAARESEREVRAAKAARAAAWGAAREQRK